MTTAQDYSTWIGKTLYDESGDKVGKIEQLYASVDTNEITFATVSTGLFGSKHTFVPMAAARMRGDDLEVPYTKDHIKDAPRIEDDAELSPQEETELYRYYGLSEGATYGGTGETTAGVTTGTTATTAGAETRTAETRTAEHRGTVGHDVSGPTTDAAMTRSEERVRVGAQNVETGRARLRKYVVTENVEEKVPVSREEVRVEREPITEANRGDALDGPELSEEEHEVVLHEERPVVEKEAVPVERVRLDTDTVTEERTVSTEARKEQIELDEAEGVARERR